MYSKLKIPFTQYKTRRMIKTTSNCSLKVQNIPQLWQKFYMLCLVQISFKLLFVNITPNLDFYLREQDIYPTNSILSFKNIINYTWQSVVTCGVLNAMKYLICMYIKNYICSLWPLSPDKVVFCFFLNI